MKKFYLMLVILITSLSLASGMAEAKRFGGGGSFGKSRPVPAKQMQREPQAAPQPAPAPAQGGASRWMGPLAGLAIGAGLATLFSHGGLGDFANNFGMLLMVVAGGLLLLALFNKLRQPRQSSQPAFGYAGANGAPQAFKGFESASSAGASAVMASNIPLDFPVDSFLRQAKASFIRLQAANDAKDLNDIRSYTTPEVFAEISLQMQERGQTEQSTEVVRIEAELLEVAEEATLTLASVRYQGVLRERSGHQAVTESTIDEIWTLQKDRQQTQAVWLLAGIQQAN